MSGARIRAAAAAVSAISGVLAGILGGWLTGKPTWGALVGVVIATIVMTGAEVVKSVSEANDGRKEGAGENDQSRLRTAVSIAVGAVGGDFSARHSVIAGRDVYQIQEIKARPNPFALFAAVCLGSLLAAGVVGTALLAREPGGVFYRSSPAGLGDPSPAVRYHIAATFQETSSTGDSITQTVAFGQAMPLTDLPGVARASGSACFGQSPSLPLSRDLVIPFRIVSTLNSDLPVQATVNLDIGDFSDTSFNDTGGLLASFQIPELIGAYGSGFGCDFDSSPGTAAIAAGKPAIPLTQPGKAVTFYGWIIFSGIISPDYLDGNASALGQTFAQLVFGVTGGTEIDSIKATGPGVCDGVIVQSVDGPVNSNLGSSPPFLHMGGPRASIDGCSGSFSGAP